MIGTMSFADRSLSAFLDALASPDPTPGGGTASAVAGAMGASLLVMVTGLAKSRHSTDEEKAALAVAREALVPLRDRLSALADEDARSFDAVMAAYRSPKSTDDEKAARKVAIQRALQGATQVPLDTVQASAEAMTQAEAVAACGNPSASSDVGVAIGLIEAAAAGAAANVRINLEGMADAGFTSSTTAELSRLIERVTAAAARARAALAA